MVLLVYRSVIRVGRQQKITQGGSTGIKVSGLSRREFDRNYTHTIHGTGIFTYAWLIFMANVGKYTILYHKLDAIGHIFAYN